MNPFLTIPATTPDPGVIEVTDATLADHNEVIDLRQWLAAKEHLKKPGERRHYRSKSLPDDAA